MLVLRKKIAVSLFASSLLTAASGFALAQDHHHSHNTEQQAQLTLNNGNKWVTDENLRLGMSRIRDALAAELHAIHSGSATAEQYHALAQKTNEQIAFMVKNCKLEQKTDAMLHLVVADLVAAVDAMTTQDTGSARKGAEKMVRALDNYGAYFDHPGWHGVHQGH